jgi:hypothetical protein
MFSQQIQLKTGKSFIQKSHEFYNSNRPNFSPKFVAVAVSLLRIFLTFPTSRTRIDFCLNAGELHETLIFHAPHNDLIS